MIVQFICPNATCIELPNPNTEDIGLHCFLLVTSDHFRARLASQKKRKMDFRFHWQAFIHGGKSFVHTVFPSNFPSHHKSQGSTLHLEHGIPSSEGKTAFPCK